MKLSPLSFLSLGLISMPYSLYADISTLPLAIRYSDAVKQSEELDFTFYLISEKLDGIRAYWTGTELLTRKGHKIIAPKWFTVDFPNVALDGELWAGRGGFNKVMNTVLDKTPNDEQWRDISFMVFDLPNSPDVFLKRYYEYSILVNQLGLANLNSVEHFSVSGESELFLMLDKITDESGEGVILRRVGASYQAGRSDALIKLKVHQDKEAVVIGYSQGKGKYVGAVGALIVKNEEGVQFKIGSGLTDKLRKNPPALGSIITYRFNDYTNNRVPKFARYIAVRHLY